MSSIKSLNRTIKDKKKSWDGYQESITNNKIELDYLSKKITQYEDANKLCKDMQNTITKQIKELQKAIDTLKRNGFNG